MNAHERGAGTLDSPAIEARLATVERGARAVLHDIDLALPAGRWSAIVGPNGAGKSTLLRALAGLQPAAGTVRLAGRPLGSWPARERARRLAWLAQAETGAEDLTAFDVAMLGRLPYQGWLGAPDAADVAAVERALMRTGAIAWRARTLGTLSGGERQRVLIARLLATEAPVQLYDEPLAHLDPPHQADWLAIAREETARGATVVSVLHELALAMAADELVVMQAGRIVHRGAPADAATRDALQSVFDGRLVFAEQDGHWLVAPAMPLHSRR